MLSLLQEMECGGYEGKVTLVDFDNSGRHLASAGGERCIGAVQCRQAGQCSGPRCKPLPAGPPACPLCSQAGQSVRSSTAFQLGVEINVCRAEG